MRVILEMKEIERALSDYLFKQGLTTEGASLSPLFLKKDHTIIYEVDKVEVYVKSQ